MRIIQCEQGTREWYAARLGVPTASEFGNIMTPKRMEYATAADSYIDELIDELVRPDAERNWGGNRHTERGKALEPEARELYAFEMEVEPVQVGFILNDAGTLGCSPDSLIRAEVPGGLEIKCPDGPKHVGWIRANKLPDEHKPQVHGSMIVTGRQWWDFMSYCPGHDRFLIRVYRDAYTEALEKHLARFLAEYEKAKAQFNLKIPEEHRWPVASTR